jgi:FimV-like protein
MKNLISLFLILILANVSIFAQDVPAKAKENPVDFALYYFQKEKSTYYDQLPQMFAKFGRYDDAITLINQEDNSYSKLDFLSLISIDLVESGNLKEANRFLDLAFTVLKDDEEWTYGRLNYLIPSFIKTNRSEEAFEILSHQEDDEDKAKIFIALAGTYFKLGNNELGEKFLNDAFELRLAFDSFNNYDFLSISMKYSPKIALEYLQQKEKDFLSIDDEKDRNRAYFDLIHYYLKLKQTKKAFQLFKEFSDKDDSLHSINLILLLLKSNDKENAISLFKKIKLNDDKSSRYGETLVEIYLQLNDIKSAYNTALEMSKSPDDYKQQESFMCIVDKYIADKKTNEALNLLDFAYKRAVKVEETHLPQHSIGASPLTRKIIYLRAIKERYFKLKMYEKGLAVLNAIKTRNDFYQEFYAETLTDFTKQQLKTFSRKTIDENLKKAINIFDENEYYNRLNAKIEIAKVYIKLGDKEKATDLLAEVLSEEESNSDFIFVVAKTFGENNLKTTPKMKEVLEKITDSEN